MKILIILICIFFTLSLGSPLPSGRVISKTNELTPDPVLEPQRKIEMKERDEERFAFDKERLKRQEEREFNKNTQPEQPIPLLP